MRHRYTFATGGPSAHLEITYAHPNVLSAGSPGRIRKVATFLDNPEIIEAVYRGLCTVHGTYKGIPVTAFSSGMGPASVSIVAPEVIEACDDNDMIIIRLGTSGGHKRDLNVGDYVITSSVLADESTSTKIMGENYLEVMPESDKIVRETLMKTAERLLSEDQSARIAPTRVTDDIYFDAVQWKGVEHPIAHAVSMEFSAFCALRDRYNRDQSRNIKAGNILMISDNLAMHGEEMDYSEFYKNKDKLENNMIRIGLEALVKLRI